MSPKLFGLKRCWQLLPALLASVLLALSYWTLNQELQQHPLTEILHSLTAIPRANLLGAIALTLLNCITFTGYDGLAVRYIQHPLPYFKTALTGLVSTVVSNSIGLSLLSGTAIRYRFYTNWGLSAVQIAKIVAFCNLGFWLGLLTVAGVAFLVQPIPVPTFLQLPFFSLRPLGLMFLVIVGSYLLWNLQGHRTLHIGNFQIQPLSGMLAIAQIAIAALDWTLSAAVLFCLLVPSGSLSFAHFFGIYLLGQTASAISNIPGGLGVFEAVLLLLLAKAIASAKILAALLAYRSIYYLAPLSLGITLLVGYELKRSLRK
jgi:uncharacterized membrane protein YbhN (UPF0104 family)